jgi:hypothetical protein
MAGLADVERGCLGRCCPLLAERLGGDLAGIRIFDSVAAARCGPRCSHMRSDIDRLVICWAMGEAEVERLVNETYPFCLECDRQLSLHFFTDTRLAAPEDERTRALLAAVAAGWIDVWPADPHATDPSARIER